jgi:hypothetical protein
VIGVISWFSPVTKLETKVDLYREEAAKSQAMEKRLEKMESDVKTAVQLAGNAEQRTIALEKKVK